MPTRIPPPTLPTTTRTQRTETPKAAPTTDATAAPAASSAPTDATGAANAFERGTRGDFVAGRDASPPAGGTSPLGARLANLAGAPASAPATLDVGAQVLARLLELVPPANASTGGVGQQLAALVNQRIAEAAAEGSSSAGVRPSDLDPLIAAAFGDAGEGYPEIAAKLTELGLTAHADGFMGVSIEMPDAKAPRVSPDAFLAELAGKLPAAPSTGNAGDQLAALLMSKLAAGRAGGEDWVTLEPIEVGDIVEAGKPNFPDIANALKALGYKASADGFMGISVGVTKPSAGDASAAPSKAEILGAFAAGVSSLKEQSAADRLAGLFAGKLAARDAGDNRVTLEPRELDVILQSAWDNPSDGYQPLADALAKIGYQASADGFIGVSVSWGD